MEARWGSEKRWSTRTLALSQGHPSRTSGWTKAPGRKAPMPSGAWRPVVAGGRHPELTDRVGAGLGSQEVFGRAVGLVGSMGGGPHPHTRFSRELPPTRLQATFPPHNGLPPDSPGAEHSRAASSTRPRPFMAAGNMLQTGLAKARGLWSGVVWGAGLAGRSLDQETQSQSSSKDPPLFQDPNATTSPEPGAGVLRELPRPHPQLIPPSGHHHCIPSWEKRSVSPAPEMPPPCAPHLWEGGFGGASYPWGAVGASGEERAGQGASGPYLRMGGGARASPPPPPLDPGWARSRGPSPLLSPALARLGAHRGSGRRARTAGWGRTHIPGVSRLRAPGDADGAGSGALRSPCGPEPGRSLVFRGTQPQTRTPREGRGGAGAGARGGRGRRETCGWGRQGLASGALSLSRPVPRPLRFPLPPPVPGAPPPPPPPTQAWEGSLPPSVWLRSPWNFSEERLLRKEAKRTKTQRGRERVTRGRC